MELTALFVEDDYLRKKSCTLVRLVAHALDQRGQRKLQRRLKALGTSCVDAWHFILCYLVLPGSFCGLALTATLTRRRIDHFSAERLPAVINILICIGGTKSVPCWPPAKLPNGCQPSFTRLSAAPLRLVCRFRRSFTVRSFWPCLPSCRLVSGKKLHFVLNGPYFDTFPDYWLRLATTPDTRSTPYRATACHEHPASRTMPPSFSRSYIGERTKRVQQSSAQGYWRGSSLASAVVESCTSRNTQLCLVSEP